MIKRTRNVCPKFKREEYNMCLFGGFFNRCCRNRCRNNANYSDIRMNRVDAGGRASCENEVECHRCGCKERSECDRRMCD